MFDAGRRAQPENLKFVMRRRKGERPVATRTPSEGNSSGESDSDTFPDENASLAPQPPGVIKGEKPSSQVEPSRRNRGVRKAADVLAAQNELVRLQAQFRQIDDFQLLVEGPSPEGSGGTLAAHASDGAYSDTSSSHPASSEYDSDSDAAAAASPPPVRTPLEAALQQTPVHNEAEQLSSSVQSESAVQCNGTQHAPALAIDQRSPMPCSEGALEARGLLAPSVALTPQQELTCTLPASTHSPVTGLLAAHDRLSTSPAAASPCALSPLSPLTSTPTKQLARPSFQSSPSSASRTGNLPARVSVCDVSAPVATPVSVCELFALQTEWTPAQTTPLASDANVSPAQSAAAGGATPAQIDTPTRPPKASDSEDHTPGAHSVPPAAVTPCASNSTHAASATAATPRANGSTATSSAANLTSLASDSTGTSSAATLTPCALDDTATASAAALTPLASGCTGTSGADNRSSQLDRNSLTCSSEDSFSTPCAAPPSQWPLSRLAALSTRTDLSTGQHSYATSSRRGPHATACTSYRQYKSRVTTVFTPVVASAAASCAPLGPGSTAVGLQRLAHDVEATPLAAAAAAAAEYLSAAPYGLGLSLGSAAAGTHSAHATEATPAAAATPPAAECLSPTPCGLGSLASYTPESAALPPAAAVENASPTQHRLGSLASHTPESVLPPATAVLHVAPSPPRVLPQLQREASAVAELLPASPAAMLPSAAICPDSLAGSPCSGERASGVRASVSGGDLGGEVGGGASDLAAAVDALALGSGDEDVDGLQQLLRVCKQKEAWDFEAFLAHSCGDSPVTKLGEGQFGEAYLCRDFVMKVVPMEGDIEVNGEPQKMAGDQLNEAMIGLALSGLRVPTAPLDDPSGEMSSTDGFVELKHLVVARGVYPTRLQAAWTAYAEGPKGTENDDPCVFGTDQLYIVFVCSNGGKDLESFRLRTFAEAQSLLLQVTMMLAVAEECLHFEHRDLHWGNVLLRPLPHADPLPFLYRDRTIYVANAGVQACLIDFTLSRATFPAAGTRHADLEADDWLFGPDQTGPQGDTYRKMREVSRRDWEAFHPGTNCCWLKYLVDTITQEKGLALTKAQAASLQNFRNATTRKNGKYSKGCRELMWHDLFKDVRQMV